MSSKFSEIQNTGKRGTLTMEFTAFYGGEQGTMLQVTQGAGLSPDEPSFIQLSYEDTYKTIIHLAEWLKDESVKRRDYLKKLIAENEVLEKTMFKDAVECEHFIADLKVLEVPIRLLT